MFSSLANIASTAMTNAANSAENYNQQSFSREMWNLNNEYNTPANQMKRLRQAGLNPHFALQNGQLGTGNSSSQATQPSPIAYDFSPIGEGVSRAVELYQQKRVQDADIGLKNAQAENQRTKNITQLYHDLSEIRQMQKSSDLTDQQKNNLKAEETRIWTDIQFQAERNQVEIDKIRSETYLNNSLERESRLKADFQEIVNQYEIPNREKVLRNLDAEYSNILSAAAANNAAAANSYASAALLGVQKDTAERLKRHIVAKAFQEVEAIKDERELKWIRENREERGEGKRFPSNVGAYETSQGFYRTKLQNRR